MESDSSRTESGVEAVTIRRRTLATTASALIVAAIGCFAEKPHPDASSSMPEKKVRVLFVCVENSNRSQMAQAFAKMYGGDKVEALSAGSKPKGIVNPKAIAAMKELGYDLSRHTSKSVDVYNGQDIDAAVTMGCGDACPLVNATRRIDWQIPDPREMPPAEFNKVRDLIGTKVKELLGELGVTG
jgi:protein-tyrosine-phosphatase